MRPQSRSLRSLLASLLAPSLVLSSPPVGMAEPGEVSASTETAFGLHTVAFDTLQGTVTVNLPDDMAAGDSISGTVIAEPKGKTEAEQTKNQDELNGYVVDVQEQKTPADQTSVKWLIPVAVSAVPVILRTRDGREIGRTQVPVAQPGPQAPVPQPQTPPGSTPPLGPNQQPSPSPGPNQQPRPTPRQAPNATPSPGPQSGPPQGSGFQLPSLGQAGKPTEIKGAFDGDFGTTTVKIGGKDVKLLAESPRKVVVQSPPDVVGSAEIRLIEQGRAVTCQFRAVRVRLSAPKTALTRGERTTMTVTVTGLDGLQTPVPLQLQNKTPRIVRMDGGDSQMIAIKPRDVGNGGSYSAGRTLTGLGPGGFSVSALVTRSADAFTACQPQDTTSAGPNPNQVPTQPPGLAPPHAPRPSPSGPKRISAASGGTITIPHATLTIPPGALSADAIVSLTDAGVPPRHQEDPLQAASSCYRVDAQPADGGNGVRLQSPGMLEIEPSSGPLQGIRDVIVAESDPDHPAVMHLHHGKGAKDGEGKGRAKLSYDYSDLGSRLCLVAVPALPEKPVEKSVLQIPWYWQGGLPWCVPTSLTEMIRYYDFTEDTDPLNAAFGPSTALANWQVAAKNGQPADKGAGYGELDTIGVKGHWELRTWDMDFLLSGAKPEGKTDFSDFVNYVTLVNTGYLGLGTRKPIAIAVDYWWHSVVVVGVDGTGVYTHDSNCCIAQKFEWLEFATKVRGLVTDPPEKPGAPPPAPKYLKTISTGIAYDYPVKPEAKRRGSIVLGPQFLDYGIGGDLVAKLAWDGAPPHTQGYHFKDGFGGDRKALRSLPLHYQYQIANVTNVPFTFKTVAEISGPTLGAGAVSRVHTVTVEPYSKSKAITGQFDQPPTAKTAFFTVKLFEVEKKDALQDVKYVRYEIEEPWAPTVAIASPVNGARVFTNSSTPLSGTSYDPTTREGIPAARLKWLVDGTFFATGASASVSFDTAGVHTIALTGTALGGAVATSTISVSVEKEPSDAPASVTILQPADGAVFDTGAYDVATASVTLLASGSPGMVLTWADSIQGTLGTGSSVPVGLLAEKTGRCAPWTEHTLSLKGIDAKARTASASVKVYVHTLCIK